MVETVNLDINLDQVKMLALDLDWLRTRKLYIATPCFNGLLTVQFHNSMLRLKDLLNHYKIQAMTSTLDRESLIPRGRNRMVHEFLASSCTDMIFIDADIGFNPGDVIQLLNLSRTYSGIIGAFYAMKEVNWARICETRDVKPEMLPALGARLVANWCEPEMDLTKPQEVRELGTGFLMFSRDVLLAMSSHVKHYFLNAEEQEKYHSDTMAAYFEAGIDDHTNQYLSEDWFFCRKWREIGGKIWACPWMVTRHVGSYEYIADLGALARAGVDNL